MPDHPTPTLHQAAEALLTEYGANGFDYLSVLDGHLIALRAALSADAAWRARAEAAIADVLAENDRLRAMLDDGFTADGDRMLPALERAAGALIVWRHEEAAARRRYEETCRAG